MEDRSDGVLVCWENLQQQVARCPSSVVRCRLQVASRMLHAARWPNILPCTLDHVPCTFFLLSSLYCILYAFFQF